MTTNTFRIRVGWSALLLALLSSASVTWGQQALPESDFPVVGIGAGQIFRVAVAVDDPDRAGERCQATLSYRNTQNRQIGPTRDVDVASNEVVVHDLDSRTLGLHSRQRINFRPVLTPSAESGPCQASFSVLDALTKRLWTYSDEPMDEIEVLHGSWG